MSDCGYREECVYCGHPHFAPCHDVFVKCPDPDCTCALHLRPMESRMQVDGINAPWINNNQPADVVVMTCTKCGWKLEMRAGDPPIPHNSPLIACPHTLGNSSGERNEKG